MTTLTLTDTTSITEVAAALVAGHVITPLASLDGNLAIWALRGVHVDPIHGECVILAMPLGVGLARIHDGRILPCFQLRLPLAHQRLAALCGNARIRRRQRVDADGAFEVALEAGIVQLVAGVALEASHAHAMGAGRGCVPGHALVLGIILQADGAAA